MKMQQNGTDLKNEEAEKDESIEITDREWKLLQQYRKLCEENRLTIDILIQRLWTHEKGRK